MLFSSIEFIFFFLPLAMAGFQLVSRFGRTPVFTFLTLMSVGFYAYWDPKITLFLAASVAGNYFVSGRIARSGSERTKRMWLVAAVALNLFALFYFKYLFPLLGFLHAEGVLGRQFGTVVLPLGISFFTFTQVAYLVDLEQGKAQHQDFVSYALFVTFFPHLIAGPIVHHREMMPQFAERRFGLRAGDVAVGISWFFMGLFKKVVLADTLAPVADAVFGHPQAYGLAAQWAGVLCYSLQLYFDFSGYSDMALALARIFSIQFPINFNSPYKAPNIIEFWQRWHMTLTRYLTLYVYNPVAMLINRRRLAAGKSVSKRAIRTAEGFLNLVIAPTAFTMLVAGVWHGAGLQFVVFGALHGVYLCVNHAWRTFVPSGSALRRLLPTPVSILLTYCAVLVPQIFFRANSAGDAMYTLATMAGLHGRGLPLVGNPIAHATHTVGLLHSRAAIAAMLAACYLIVWALPNTQELLGESAAEGRWYGALLPRLQWQPSVGWAVCLSGAFFAVLMLLVASTSFLYFQF